MKSEHKFNALNGCKNVSRHELEGIINLAKIENNSDVVFRLSKVLNDQPQEQYFNIAVASYSTTGLNGAQHTGDYKEALDDCGRLRHGFHFVNGKVVKVVAKPKPAATKKPVIKKTTTTKKQVVTKKPNEQQTAKEIVFDEKKVERLLHINLKSDIATYNHDKWLIDNNFKNSSIGLVPDKARKNKEYIKLKKIMDYEILISKKTAKYLKDDNKISMMQRQANLKEYKKRLAIEIEKVKKINDQQLTKEIIGYALVDNVTSEIVASKKTLSELKTFFEKLVQVAPFDELPPLIYEIYSVNNKNVLGNKIDGFKNELTPQKKEIEVEKLAPVEPKNSILITTETFRKMTVSELKKFTLTYYNENLKGKKVAIENHLKEVVFVGGAGRKILKPMYSEKVAVLEHLEELIKNSTYNNFGNRKETDSKDVLGYLNFKSKITIDGVKRHVRISVILDIQRKTNFKTFEVGGNKKSGDLPKVAVASPKDGDKKPLSENKTTNIIPKKEIEAKKNSQDKPKPEIKTTNFEQKYKVSFTDLIDFLSAGSMDLPMIYNNYEFATIEPNYTQFATDFLNHKYYNNIKVSGKGYKVFEYDSKETLTIPVEIVQHFAVKTPAKKDFITNLKNIISKDKLRPVMTGIFVDKEYYVATDAHVLVCLSNADNTTEVGKIIRLDLEKEYKDYIKAFGSGKPELSKANYSSEYKYIDGKYPQYENVIPKYKNFTALKDVNYWITICENFLKFTQAEKGLINTLVIGTPENEVILNVKMALRVFKSLAENGNQKIKIGYSAKNKAIIAKTEGKDFGLIMPIQNLDSEFITSERINLPDGFNENGLSGLGLNSLFKNEGLKATAKDKDTIAFNKLIIDAKRNGILDSKVLSLGTCKNALLKFAGNHKIFISGKIIKKTMTKDKNHSLTFEHYINLPDYINNPIAIFKSDTVDDSLVVLTELKNHLEKPIIVAIHIGKTIKINQIKSLYSKDSLGIYAKWIKKGLLLYEDKKSDLFQQLTTLIIAERNKSLNKDNTKGLNIANDIKKSKKTLKGVGLISNVIGNVIASSVLGQPAKTSIAAQMKQRANTKQEYYIIPDRDISNFLGKIEKKQKESVAITLTGGQGSMKTRLCFQLMNTLAQNYKVGHASIEEHPASTLYYDKVHQYLNKKAMHNVSAPEINSIDDVHKLCRENDVIVIDSFSKLQEMQRGCELDKDFRKRYDGKLFIIIYQLTSDGKMRGGAKSQFDGDIIGFIKKEPNYKENYCYWDKNRYQNKNLDDLKFNIYQGKLQNNQQEPEAENNLEFSFNVK